MQRESSLHIPYIEKKHKQAVLDKLAVSEIQSPMFTSSDKNVFLLYSGLTLREMPFIVYPVLFSNPEKANSLFHETKIEPGAHHPKYIFAALRSVFVSLFPDREPGEVVHWELWKFNQTYYSKNLTDQILPEELAVDVMFSDVCGGPFARNPIKWEAEMKGKRARGALPIRAFIESSKPVPISDLPERLHKASKGREKKKKDIGIEDLRSVFIDTLIESDDEEEDISMNEHSHEMECE